jgi:hypothetical protein
LTRDADCSAIEIAFLQEFAPSAPGYFQRLKGNYPGLHDGANGVQWNAWHDHEDHRVTLGVNLEGMQFDGWPIGRLIDRELHKPTLPELATKLAHAIVPGVDIRLLWWRDTWQDEHRVIKRDATVDIPLSKLTPDVWQGHLVTARGWLADGGRGRRELSPPKQGQSTSPHFQITTMVWLAMPTGPGGYSERNKLMTNARGRLDEFHDWAALRAAL